MIKEKYGNEKQMESIKTFLECAIELYTVYEIKDQMEALSDNIKFLFVAPHEGNNNKWLLRASTIAAFDRWANSTGVEQFFDTEIELCNYLYDYLMDIYIDLIKYLSAEYTELEEYCEELDKGN